MRPHPWDSPGKNTGVGCHFLLQCLKVKSESEVAQSCLDYSRPHGLQPTRLLRPWDFPGKSTWVGCHCLLRLSICYMPNIVLGVWNIYIKYLSVYIYNIYICKLQESIVINWQYLVWTLEWGVKEVITLLIPVLKIWNPSLPNSLPSCPASYDLFSVPVA